MVNVIDANQNHVIPVKMARIKSRKIRVGKDVQKMEPSHVVAVESSLEAPQKVITIPLLSI